MAHDPNMTDEQKRRLRRGTYLAGKGISPEAFAPPPSRAPRPYAAGEGAGGSGGGGRVLRRGAQAPGQFDEVRGTPAAARATVPDYEAQDRNLEAQGVDVIRRGRGARGETVYTNVPGDGLIQGPAETLYYGAEGQRVGQGLSRESPDFYQTVTAQNDRQLAARGKLNQELAERRERDGDLQWVDDPNSLTGRSVMNRTQRIAAGIEKPPSGPDFGDLIASLNFQRQVANDAAAREDRDLARVDRQRGLARQELGDLRQAWRDNPQATLQEELGVLRGLSPDEIEAELSSPRGRLLLTNLDALFSSSEGSAASPLAQLFGRERGTTGFGDLVPAPGVRQSWFGPQEYVVSGDEFLGPRFTAEDFGGLAPSQLQQLIDFYRRRQAAGGR